MAAHNGRTPMPAVDLRRRVRRITAATVGAAALAASALTVNLAWATDDPAAGTSATDGNQAGSISTDGPTRAPAAPERDEADGEDEDEGAAQAPAAQPGITAPSAPLAAPRQAPLAGSGRSHTQSGGS